MSRSLLWADRALAARLLQSRYPRPATHKSHGTFTLQHHLLQSLSLLYRGTSGSTCINVDVSYLLAISQEAVHETSINVTSEISSIHEKWDGLQHEPLCGLEGQSQSLGNHALVPRYPDQPALSDPIFQQDRYPHFPTEEHPPIQHHLTRGQDDTRPNPSALPVVPFVLELIVSLIPAWSIPFGV
ncbi:hypothetical protein M427DRAFT_48450 [Gonapodya prolifera JEL478]|uniref:Uncharacterized protein n=1 Tax=Gonapodya prolifera (strain JEL478) TaxID=1344416 RepID=A0A139A0N8_GONPJ|nr:hypothetical protein M427DRAFT_48450 [Gonapodya prolifera JEL478]|eukprot:KXS10347.1 hypothetical protein M427DRAFT_48450 [Gonapodya prolifera JEL478]